MARTYFKKSHSKSTADLTCHLLAHIDGFSTMKRSWRNGRATQSAVATAHRRVAAANNLPRDSGFPPRRASARRTGDHHAFRAGARRAKAFFLLISAKTLAKRGRSRNPPRNSSVESSHL